ncbi:hypothetical protein LCGC14_2918050, partial [marine sediment metagenome]
MAGKKAAAAAVEAEALDEAQGVETEEGEEEGSVVVDLSGVVEDAGGLPDNRLGDLVAVQNRVHAEVDIAAAIPEAVAAEAVAVAVLLHSPQVAEIAGGAVLRLLADDAGVDYGEVGVLRLG